VEKPSIRELAGNHPVALRNAIEALTRRWAHMVKSGARAPIALTRVPAAIYPGDREGPPP